MKARQLPITVNVWQLNSTDTMQTAPKWVIDNLNKKISYSTKMSDGRPMWVISSMEGNMIARDGDYLIQGILGELYPCNRQVFEQTYEIVGEE